MANLHKVLCLFVLVLMSCLFMTEANPQFNFFGFGQNGNGNRNGNGNGNGNGNRRRPGNGNGRRNGNGNGRRSRGRSDNNRSPASPFGIWRSGYDQDGYSRNGRDVSHVLAAATAREPVQS